MNLSTAPQDGPALVRAHLPANPLIYDGQKQQQQQAVCILIKEKVKIEREREQGNIVLAGYD